MFSIRPAGFLIAFAVAFGLLAFGIPLFNFIIDPYWAFGAIEIKGFNAVKPQFTNELRLGKALAVCRLKPDAVILGSSRAELSLDPEHPGFARLSQRAYNLAMSGTGIHEMLRTLQHAYYASDNTLKVAIVALDDLMFNANRERVVFGTEVLGYDEDRLVLSAEQSCRRTFLHDVDQLLFAKGIKPSLKTLWEQDSQEVYVANGMRDQNMLAKYVPAVGYRSDFQRNEKYYIEKIWTAGRDRRFCFEADGYGSTIDTLRTMVRFAREHNIELRFLLSPIHARMLITAREAGLWPVIENYKRAIVRVLEEDAAQNPGRKPFQLWDFYTFNSITTEPVPAHTHMKWHWEASHYKLATGTLVLDRVLGYREPGRDVPDDFGVPLTGENIEGELNKLLADSRLYDRQYPEYVAEIRDRAEQVLEGRTGVMCTPSYQALQTAAAALDSGDRAGAMMQIDRAALLQAEEMAEFKRRGLPYREAGLATMIQKARETGIIERLLETWEAYQERGIKRLTNGDRAGAITDFGEAIRRGPPNAALHYLRGTARAQMGNHTGAIEDFDVILKLDPGNVTVPILREQSLAVLKAAAK